MLQLLQNSLANNFFIGTYINLHNKTFQINLLLTYSFLAHVSGCVVTIHIYSTILLKLMDIKNIQTM